MAGAKIGRGRGRGRKNEREKGERASSLSSPS